MGNIKKKSCIHANYWEYCTYCRDEHWWCDILDNIPDRLDCEECKEYEKKLEGR
jgi:hypothetical protein